MEKKLIKPLILPISLMVFLCILGLIIPGTGFVNSLPGEIGFHISFIFCMSAVAGIIGGVFIGYLLAPVFLVAHKYTVGIRMKYGIQERPEPTKLKLYFKAIFPALMTLNLVLMFANSSALADLLVNPGWIQDDNKVQIPMVLMATLLPFMSGVAMGLFSPVWFLLDARIVFTNKEKVKDTRDPIEVRSVGGWYHYMLKGYAGIAVIITFILFASVMVETMDNPSVFLLIFLPIILMILYIPAFVILEMTAEHRNKYMLKVAEKFGIKEALADPLDLGN